MAVTPEPKDFQTEVLDRLERLENKLDADVQRIDERTDKWEERFLKYEQMTSSWLVKYRIPLDYTFMRPSGNRARDCDLKPKMLIDLFGSKENVQEKVLVVLEDRDRVVEAFREMGLPCWQVQAGGY
jgi:hypothetical protein